MVKSLKGLLGNLEDSMPEIQSLLKPESIKKTETLLGNGADLLSKQFVKNTTDIISDVSEFLPLIEGLLNSL